MVEIRHCDRCGSRLPVDLVPGTGASCPKCGHPVEDGAGPADGAAALRAASSRPKAGVRGAPGPGGVARRAAVSERAEPAQGASNALVFGGAAGVGVVAALAAGLLLVGRRGEDRDASPPLPEVGSAGGTDAGTPTPTGGGEARAPADPGAAPGGRPVGDAAAPVAPGDEPHPAADGAPVVPVEPAAGDQDDFFAKLRAGSAARREKLATVRKDNLPDPPPTPDVRLSDLEPLVASCGWGDAPKMDRSIENRPLRVGGREYAKGIGTHSHSEIVFAVEPRFRRFVAKAGIDDETNGGGSVTFEVRVDGEILWASEAVRAGRLWHFDVPIPAGGRELTLAVTDAGDGMGSDHADWLDAGFVTAGE